MMTLANIEMRTKRQRADRAAQLLRQELTDRDKLLAVFGIVFGFENLDEVREALARVHRPAFHERDIQRAISHEVEPLFATAKCGTCEEEARKVAPNLVPPAIGNETSLP